MADNSQPTEGTQEISKTQEAAEKITTAQPDTNTAVEAGKTFTQADVDRIIAERLQRERAKLPNDDELKAYREWKKSQQSEAEKAAEREKELAELHSKKTDLERELAVLKAGVRAKDADYVIFKVSRMDGDFSDNLARFLKENTEFTQPETVKVEGTKHTISAPEQEDGVTKEFLKRNPNLKI
jgi:DNA helicase IV